MGYSENIEKIYLQLSEEHRQEHYDYYDKGQKRMNERK